MRWLCGCLALVAAVALVTQAVADAAPHGPPFAFGGIGPKGAYTVDIAGNGSVHATGNGGLTRIGRPQLTPTELSALNRSATRARFGSLPTVTRCAAATAASTTWIRVGSKKVTVDGACRPAYQQLFKALVAAVHFYTSA